MRKPKYKWPVYNFGGREGGVVMQGWFNTFQLEYWSRDGQGTCFEFWPPQTGEVLKYKEGDWQIPSKYLQIVRTGKGLTAISDLRESRFSRILKIFFKFHFSISSHFYFTFISRKERRRKKFHPFSREKEWNLTPKFIRNLTIWGGWRTQNK